MEAMKMKHRSCGVFDHIQITRQELLVILKCIQVGPPQWEEGSQVHSWILWEAREETIEALAEIITSSLATHEGLEDWRMANVVTII